MRRTLTLVLLSAVVNLAAGSGLAIQKSKPQNDLGVNVAFIGMERQYTDNVVKVLEEEHINPTIFGSRGFGVWVRASEFERAKKALIADREKHPTFYKWISGDPKEEAYAGVGAISGREFPTIHVRNLLKSHGIGSLIEGSIVYGIQVPESRKEEAKKVLLEDVKKHPYHYVLLDGYKGKLGTAAVTHWKTIKFDVDLASAAVTKEFKADPILKGLLTEAKIVMIAYGNSPKKPYLSKIKFMRMEYMNDAGKWDVGYYGDVTIRPRTTGAEIQSSAYSWDGGKRHERN